MQAQRGEKVQPLLILDLDRATTWGRVVSVTPRLLLLLGNGLLVPIGGPHSWSGHRD
jgi:hypothetical protein